MRPDIVPGAVLPDYDLSNHRGKHRTLSELQGADPLVLVLSRGGFCPKDRRQHEGPVEELRLDLRAALQRCRPDWDISRAEQRAAWERGEKAGFHPYGRTLAQVLAEH